MASVSCFMTSTRRSCPLTFSVSSRSTLPGADVWPLSRFPRNTYAADDTAAPVAITPLMKLRRVTLADVSSIFLLSSMAGPPRQSTGLNVTPSGFFRLPETVDSLPDFGCAKIIRISRDFNTPAILCRDPAEQGKQLAGLHLLRL